MDSVLPMQGVVGTASSPPTGPCWWIRGNLCNWRWHQDLRAGTTGAGVGGLDLCRGHWIRSCLLERLQAEVQDVANSVAFSSSLSRHNMFSCSGVGFVITNMILDLTIIVGLGYTEGDSLYKL
ncbi:hypothetical protein U9M48_034281 [Paspalum notatum var. saurae]|uniref:Uncharacterized protein n=1 Tax=Paspalum notatum var. saurae TaxID=547442 RepID=A0AAQ3UCF1_PASNO